MTNQTGSSSLNPDALFKISYGLYVVSSRHNDKLNGYISNAVFQVTAEPPQFAVCCSKNNYTADLISRSNILSISILKKDVSSKLIGTFGYKSGRDIDKFVDVRFKTGAAGSPILLEDSLAWFECRVVNTFDVGTHLIFIAQIIENDIIDKTGEPLTYAYYREMRNGKAPKNAPTYINPETVKETLSDKSKYKCIVCGYIYDPATGDPEQGVPAGTDFNDLSENWKCPVCGADKHNFEII